MENLSLYEAAHLVTAAIRVIEFTEQQPPSVEAVAALLSVSAEQVLRISRKLEKEGIINIITGGYGDKLFIRDHQAIESLPQEAGTGDMTSELERFKAEQKERDKKIEAIRQKEEERKRKLFDQIEQQFKGKTPETGNSGKSSGP